MTANEIVTEVVGACTAMRAKGFLLERNSFGYRDGEGNICGGCALTALAVANGVDVRGEDPTLICTNTVRGFAAHRYNWNSLQVSGFIDGYDACDRDDTTDKDAFDIGAAVRAALFVRR